MFNHFMPHAVGTDTQMTTNSKIFTRETAKAHASRRPCNILVDVVSEGMFNAPASTTASAETPGANLGT